MTTTNEIAWPARRRMARFGRAALLGAGAMAVALGAHAQSSACDTLRSTLTARIESGGVRGYSLELLPAKTPTPSGAKVIGTCDGGAFKMAYRRWALAKPEPKPAPPAAAREPVPPQVPPPAPPATTATPAPSAPAPVSLPASEAAPPAPMAPVTLVAVSASEPAPLPAPALETVAAPADVPRPPQPEVAGGSWSQGVLDWASEYRWWIAAALLLPLLLGSWAWWSHHRDYDEAGLPRGPRL